MSTEKVPVDVQETVLRLVHPKFFDAALPLPVQPEAFRPLDDEPEGISVMRRRFVERPEDALLMAAESKRELYYVAEIPVSELQRLGLSASPDPTADAPGHALVPELNSTVYHQDKASKAKCKGIQKELAVIASRNIVHRPPAADSQAS